MSIEVPSFRIDARELLQHVSRVTYRDTPPYFGRDGTNRYDAPARDYGVLYLGRDLSTALMESVFHKHQWDQDTKRSIALREVQSRLVRAVGVLEALNLADLTAPGVMANCFGLNLEQLASRDCRRDGHPAATFASRNSAAGIERRRRQTNAMGRSPLCDS
ncbi:MAG: RES domain-containing protein [Acidobacteria bacterium]|nr:RES domain-containing protein [Acidobacteriota bacterium]